MQNGQPSALAADNARLRFGTAGVPASIEGASHLAGLQEVVRLGLEAMELAFVQQVKVDPQEIAAIKGLAAAHNIALSAHAPYFVNLNSADRQVVGASRQRIVKAAQVAEACGATRVVFHCGWRHDATADEVYTRVRDQLLRIQEELSRKNVAITLCPETTGKVKQFGDLSEVLRLCQELPGVEPCVDFAHLFARHGGAFGPDEFEATVQSISRALGPAALLRLHIHVSGIEYGRDGEIRHLPLQQSALDYSALLACLLSHNVTGVVICESPTNDTDALLLQQAYRQAKAARKGQEVKPDGNNGRGHCNAAAGYEG